MPDRIQKLIARAGVTSRRKAEILITEGLVTVNGEVVTKLGSKADLSKDTVYVDGKALRSQTAKRYLAMYKPKGCITTTSDPEGRPTVMDLIGPELAKGLFPVGRLDYNTEGLLLLTNDGDFGNHVLSAKNEIPKAYEVKVTGMASETALEKLRAGFRLDGRPVRFEAIRLLREAANPWYRVTLVQGRNRQIHRMFERFGLLVEKIRRISIGRVMLRGLEPRQVRTLRQSEIKQLLSDNQPRADELNTESTDSPNRGRFGRRSPARSPRGTRTSRSARDRGGRRPGTFRSRTSSVRDTRRGTRPRRSGPNRGGPERSSRGRGQPGRGRGRSGERPGPKREFRRSDRPRRSSGPRRPSSGASRGYRGKPGSAPRGGRDRLLAGERRGSRRRTGRPNDRSRWARSDRNSAGRADGGQSRRRSRAPDPKRVRNSRPARGSDRRPRPFRSGTGGPRDTRRGARARRPPERTGRGRGPTQRPNRSRGQSARSRGPAQRPNRGRGQSARGRGRPGGGFRPRRQFRRSDRPRR